MLGLGWVWLLDSITNLILTLVFLLGFGSGVWLWRRDAARSPSGVSGGISPFFTSPNPRVLSWRRTPGVSLGEMRSFPLGGFPGFRGFHKGNPRNPRHNFLSAAAAFRIHSVLCPVPPFIFIGASALPTLILSKGITPYWCACALLFCQTVQPYYIVTPWHLIFFNFCTVKVKVLYRRVRMRSVIVITNLILTLLFILWKCGCIAYLKWVTVTPAVNPHFLQIEPIGFRWSLWLIIDIVLTLFQPDP